VVYGEGGSPGVPHCDGLRVLTVGELTASSRLQTLLWHRAEPLRRTFGELWRVIAALLTTRLILFLVMRPLIIMRQAVHLLLMFCSVDEVLISFVITRLSILQSRHLYVIHID
jgi:hypothetical protein